jgi:hypothetical protein
VQAVPSRRQLVAACAAAAVVFLAASLVAEGGLLRDRPWGDVNQYERYGRALLDGRIPYDDFYMEYPPGALPVFVAPALVTDEPPAYLDAFKWLMALIFLGAIAATGWSLRTLRAPAAQVGLALGLLALTPLLLGHVFLNRYDPWPAVLVALSLAALLAGRRTTGGGLLGAGAAAKLLPACAAPVVALHVWRREGTAGLVRAAAAAAAVLALAFLPFVAVAPGGVGFSVWTQLRRHLHTESIGGSLLLAADELGLRDARIVLGDPGSVDVGGLLADALGVVSTLAQAAAVLLVLALAWRRRDSPAALVLAFAATVVGFTTFAKVISPQFLTWLVPLVPLVAGRAGRLATLLLAVALLLTEVEQRGWDGLTVDSWAAWSLLARNAVLVAVFVVLTRALAAEPLRKASVRNRRADLA